MAERPYLSVVVTARNDDHGGSLLRRMQAFVNAWIAQSRRHGLSSELVVVEWNPPQDRPPLMDALKWPADTRPCEVRFISVPPEIHLRYKHAEAMPLYQMIAKNAGIRRSRGRFVLATNIDILFSDGLVRYLAQGRLEPGRMYRIDRHDVMSDGPVDGPVGDQLAYCETHLIRINTREGTFSLTPGGVRALSEEDIAGRDSGISFGPGWYSVERDLAGVFRWVDNDAEVVLRLPGGPPSPLLLDVEPGPSARGEPLWLQAVDDAGRVLAETEIRKRATVEVKLSESGNFVQAFRFHVVGGGLSLPHDPRVLNLRVNRCEWASAAESSGRVAAGAETHSRTGAPRLWIHLMHLVNWLAGEEPAVNLTLPVPPLLRRLARVYVGVGGLTGLLQGGLRRYRESQREVPCRTAGPLHAAPMRVEVSGPVLLHTNACGDFTLMAREHWFDLRGYPEFDLFSFNLDSVLCYAAHHGGAREEVLADPLRIYHIEHGTGSGWTPEGQAQLFERLRAKGIPWLEYRELVTWAAQMRRLDAPMIFNRENWGLVDLELKETILPTAAAFTN